MNMMHPGDAVQENDDAVRAGFPFGIAAFANVPAHIAGPTGFRESSPYWVQVTHYTSGAGSEYVQEAVMLRRQMQTAPSRIVFLPSSAQEQTSHMVEELAQDTEFLGLFESRDDLVRFTAMLPEHPELLKRTMTLAESMRASDFVGSVSIEVDEEDGDVVVWTALNVDDDSRLQVKMQLFEEAQSILGPLTALVLLATF